MAQPIKELNAFKEVSDQTNAKTFKQDGFELRLNYF